MACRSRLARNASCVLLLLVLILSGCVSLRFDKITRGADVPMQAEDLRDGKSTLTDVLARYGAPTDVVDMNGKFAIIYKKSFYQGGQLSFGIPLPDLRSSSGPSLEAAGTLLRHDLLALFFTPEGLLIGTTYEKGAGQPFWGSFLK